MEIPILPLLVGGVLIMALISYSEDRLDESIKDPENKKVPLKYWNKESPLRNALKTAVDLKLGIDMSDEDTKKKIIQINRDFKTLAKGVVRGDVRKGTLETHFKNFEKDLKSVKTEKQFLKTIEKHDRKIKSLIPKTKSKSKSQTYERVEEGHFRLGKPKGILKNPNRTKLKTKSEKSASMPKGKWADLEGSVEKIRQGVGPSLDGGKKRTKKRMSRKKSKKAQRSKRK